MHIKYKPTLEESSSLQSIWVLVVEALSYLLRFSYKNTASALIKLESPILFLT
jgi:hypothetical protein